MQNYGPYLYRIVLGLGLYLLPLHMIRYSTYKTKCNTSVRAPLIDVVVVVMAGIDVSLITGR